MNGKKGKAPINSTPTSSEEDFQFSVNLKIGEKQLNLDVDKKLRIPSIDILTSQKACNMMAENPSLHARWNVLANQAACIADMEKIRFEVFVKEKAKLYRADLLETSGRRVTDKQVEEAVMTDPEYLRKYKDYLDKKENAANIRSVAMGFGERGERLVNITSMMKWEKPTSMIKKGREDSAVYADDNETEAAAFSDKPEESSEES
jgi:hypothetical protein